MPSLAVLKVRLCRDSVRDGLSAKQRKAALAAGAALAGSGFREPPTGT